MVYQNPDEMEPGYLPGESQKLLNSLDDSCPSLERPNALLRFGSIELLKTWFPHVDPDYPQKSLIRRLSTRGVALFMIQLISIVVLILNLAITAYAMTRRNSEQQNFVDIIEPNGRWTCDSVRQYNRWMHFAINALSTILLGASNYCAQLVVAPTRRLVDDAHSKGTWVDIGIQSFRNLWKVDLRRQVLWTVLMLSSGFLHLFWNSAVFAATPFNTYNVGLVTADFLDDQMGWQNTLPVLEDIRNATPSLEKISKVDCISRYAGKTSGLASILVVSANQAMSQQLSDDVNNPASSLLANFTTVVTGSDWGLNSDWMCSAWALPGLRSSFTCTENFLMPHNDTWTLDLDYGMSKGNAGFKVDYCLALDNGQPMDHACALRISPMILLIVTGLNLFKCVAIACTAYVHRHDSYRPSQQSASKEDGEMGGKTPKQPNPFHLVTIGDAIASFLDEEDEHTKRMDLSTKETFIKGWPSPQHQKSRTRPKIVLWFRAASLLRWFITLSFCIALISIVGAILGITISSQRAVGVNVDLASLWSYGVGDARQWAVALTTLMRKLNQTTGFFFAVFFANLFQVVVSALYLLYNNLLTVMVAASEWNDFISERKTLRLSAPRGIQRSNYFLSLPYRYSLFLMTCSGLLHWLISQSVFVVQTVAYSPSFERDLKLDASSIGYSSIGIIFAMATGVMLVVGIMIIGFTFKYKPKPIKHTKRTPAHPMPLVSTCSAAISANCHKHPEDIDCSLLPVIWGFVEDKKGRGIGHYTFTTAGDVGSDIIEM